MKFPAPATFANLLARRHLLAAALCLGSGYGTAAATAAEPVTPPMTAPAPAQTPRTARWLEDSTGLDWPLCHEPQFDTPPAIYSFDQRILELWLQALQRPDVETRRQAVTALGEAGHYGFVEIAKQTGPQMLALLQDPQLHRQLLVACTQALARMDYRPAAERFTTFAAGHDGEIIDLVDPALAAWKHQPAYDIWLKRLRNPDAPRTTVLSALAQLTAVGQAAVIPTLREFVLDAARDEVFRLVAARDLVILAPDAKTHEADARRVYASTALPERLLAATLLLHASGDGVQELLLKMAQDQEPAVIAVALQRLTEIDPALVAPLNVKLAANADTNVRRLLVDTLEGQQTPAGVELLARLLDDINIPVRTAARNALIRLDRQARLQPTVRSAGTAQLAPDHWRSLEQAADVLGVVHETSVAPRLLELQRFERPEVRIAAAVALRRLNLPETLEPMRLRAVELTELWVKEPLRRHQENWDVELGQLVQTMGLRRYAPSEPLLIIMIPKGSFGGQARAAGIWALGKVHQGPPINEMAEDLLSRMNDNDIIRPEDPDVRIACPVALGHMKAKDQIDALRGGRTQPAVQRGCDWAISEITGEPLPVIPTPELSLRDWFLTPLER